MPALAGPASADLLAQLESRRSEIESEMLRDLGALVPAYSELAGDELTRVAAHCHEHVSAFLGALRRGRPPGGEELEFVRQVGRRRAREGFELENLMRGYRSGMRVLSRWIARCAGPDGASLQAALSMTQALIEHGDAINTSLAEGYHAEGQRVLAESRAAARDLVEDLLAGHAGPALAARCRQLGLDPEQPLQVAVARPYDPARGLETTEKQLRMAGFPALAVHRHDHVVLMAPATVPLRSLLERSGPRQPMRAGISLPVTSLGDPVVQAHREALQALALAAPGQVVRLSDLSLFDYLVATADETSRRLAPRGLPAVDGVLRSTLDAYASADLNAERAAQRLAVHPNTVHYRLGRVRRLTGRDPRRLPDLVELMAGLRMFPCESA
jgi:hypothetical protein